MYHQKTYPNILQSWGIVGIAVLAILPLLPLQIWLLSIASKELATFVIYVLNMAAPLSFAWYIRKKESGIVGFTFKSVSPKMIALVSLGALGLQFGLLSPIKSLIPMPDFMKDILLEIGNLKGVFAFLTLSVAAPILEELIFRGIILDGLLKRYSPARAIFISSLLFGIVHLNPWQFITAMGLGVFMGWIYHKTHNLTLCVIIHFVNNLVATLMMQFVNMEEEMEKTFFEGYGGVANTFIIITGAITIAICCFILLKRIFNHPEEGNIEPAVNNELDLK